MTSALYSTIGSLCQGVFDMQAIENNALKPGPWTGPTLVQFLKAHQTRINTRLIQFWSTWSARSALFIILYHLRTKKNHSSEFL